MGKKVRLGKMYYSEVMCSKCGRIAPITRVERREAGHFKHTWCVSCKARTLHFELSREERGELRMAEFDEKEIPKPAAVKIMDNGTSSVTIEFNLGKVAVIEERNGLLTSPVSFNVDKTYQVMYEGLISMVKQNKSEDEIKEQLDTMACFSMYSKAGIETVPLIKTQDGFIHGLKAGKFLESPQIDSGISQNGAISQYVLARMRVGDCK